MAQVAGLHLLIPTKTQTPCHLHRGPWRNLAAATYSIHTWSSLQQSLNCSGKFSCLFSDNRKKPEVLNTQLSNTTLRKDTLFGYCVSLISSIEPNHPLNERIFLIYRNDMPGCLVGKVNEKNSAVVLRVWFGQKEQAQKALESALGEKKMEFEKWDKEIKRREEAGGGGNSGGGGRFRWGRWFGGSDGDHFWQEAQQASLAILGILVVYLIVAKGDVILAVVFNPLLFALRGTRTGFTFLTSKISNMIHPGGENMATPRDDMARNVSAKERVIGKWGSN